MVSEVFECCFLALFWVFVVVVFFLSNFNMKYAINRILARYFVQGFFKCFTDQGVMEKKS